jgi:hypothetical protein
MRPPDSPASRTSQPACSVCCRTPLPSASIDQTFIVPSRSDTKYTRPSGRFVPSTAIALQIARQFNVPVEAIFSLREPT